MYTLAFVNQKGGVGKTTLCLNVAARLRASGAKVLLVDMDPQCNLTYSLGVDHPEKNLWDVLSGHADAAAAVLQSQEADILPGSPNLSLLERALTGADRSSRLRGALKVLSEQYHFIIIDSPPALSLLMLNVLGAADSVVIPALADVFSLQGIGQLASTIRAVQSKANPGLKLDGILLSKQEGYSQQDQDTIKLLETIAERLGTQLFQTRIAADPAVREAQAKRQSVLRSAPGSQAAADYGTFTLEYLKRLRQRFQV